MREWITRLLDWLRRDALNRELAEELRFHRQLLERDAAAAGAERGEVPYLAARRLGNVTRVREEARERWSIPWLDQLQQDVRHALRGLRRSPGFTATVVVTLALGIGANAAMFDVVDRLMFRPLAYLHDPGTVHRLYLQWQARGQETTASSTQYARYLDLRRWTSSFSQMAGFSERPLAVGDGPAARERRVGVVSASFFDFFDARPALGRFFTAAEDVTPRGADVAVLSYAFWQSAFGGRDVRGERLRVGNVHATIVGVAPPGFAGMNDADPPAVYIPITTFAGSTGTDDAKTYFSRYDWGWMQVMVRRRPGVTVARAEADASQALRRSWLAARAMDPGIPPLQVARPHVRVASLRPGAGPAPALEARTALWVTGVAAIVLVIACANVANLFLARALRRRREAAVRLALGVSRGRLVRQAVTESLVLALLGGAAALLVAQWAGAAIRQLLLTTRSTAPEVLVFTDWRTLGVTLGLAVATGVLVGLVPALLSGRRGAFAAPGVDLAATLRGGVRGGMAEGARLRAALLVVQGALSVVLLVGAALFVRSLQAVRAMPMGYDAERVLLVERVIQGATFDDSVQTTLRRLLLTTAQALPGVESAAWVSSAPFVSTSSTSLFVAGIDSVGRLGTFTYQATTPDYFRTMSTRILRGRAFTPADRAGAPEVAVVSESMARVLWPGRDALGQCFRMRADSTPCRTVVGVAEDMVQRDLFATQRYHYYVPIEQYGRTWGNGMLLRLRGDPTQQAESIRTALQRVMPGASYVTVLPLRHIVQDAQRPWRLGATMFAVFGGLALVVAAVGLYGVITYDVAQRQHELGVRVALGAQRGNILRLVVGRSVRLAVAGTVLGALAAVVASRWLQPLLFRQSATDPLVYGGVGGAMLVVALAASALPALRAARADPNGALRAE
ncbi:MAG TPA: ADOP family duplicated permease [Gemmatimonadaceae bacterium]|nr:ADOP family duplicated permease [Gemmatimonadaceae bacterium]